MKNIRFSGILQIHVKVAWATHDASELVAGCPFDGKILIDQGSDDQFLKRELHPDAFRAA